MNHIFISHSHADSDFAENLHKRLEEAGLRVWRDTSIRGGEDWRREIDQAIQEASTLIVVMTSEAKASEYVTYEWAFAEGAGVKVVPLMLKRTELHPRLELLQYLDFTNREARPWEKLMMILREAQSSKLQAEQPVHRVHGYSGFWEVENRFSRWRDYELGANDTVYWHGKTFILLSPDGKKGAGTQNGKLFVSVGNYKAMYDNINQVNRANVMADGTLQMDMQVISRVLIREEGEPPEARLREPLFGSGEYHLELKPLPGELKMLRGKHTYLVGNKIYQEAEETHRYLGF